MTPRRLRRSHKHRRTRFVLKVGRPLTAQEAEDIRAHVQYAERHGLPLVVGPGVEVIDLEHGR